MSLGLSLLMSVFVLAALLGAPLGFAMLASGFAYLIATHQDMGLVLDQTMNGLYNSYLLIAVPLFIFVANVMSASGVITRLLAFGSALVGHRPGGLAQVNILANLVFSGMSGSAVADVSGPGLIVARMMAKGGQYPRGFAAATSVASATLGPLMPTSIPLLFYALIANTSVAAMLISGLVPAALMAGSMMVLVAIISWRRGFPREIRIPRRELPGIILRALPPLMLPVILLGLIYSGVTTPTEAAAIAAAYALCLALVVYRSVSISTLWHAVHETVRGTCLIALIMSGAFVFNYTVSNENVPQMIQATLVSWNLSPLAFLFITDVLMLLLAVALDEVTILLVIVPLLVPISQGLGINPVHYGVVVVVNMMVGLALPPHGLLLFVIAGLTHTPLVEIFREIAPFVAVMLLVVVLVTVFPQIALWLPTLAHAL